jgi:bifunctional oligoribonuclease and PAP phosphatase NrnA
MERKGRTIEALNKKDLTECPLSGNFAPLSMEPIRSLYPQLHQAKRVLIVMHQKPDPDAMGSSLALAHFLRSFGHAVQVVSPTNWPAFLDWMPGCKNVLDYEAYPEKVRQFMLTLTSSDWVFCLDFNALHRAKGMAIELEQTPAVRILLDHHRQPQEEMFEYGNSDILKSSTSEMVYDLIVESGHGESITEEIAECLYAGVIGDTGSFRFPITTAAVHSMIAALLRKGLQHTKVHEALYDNFLENRLRFIGQVLLHRMEIFYEYNAALITIPKSDLIRYEIKTGDTEGLVNYPLTIKGIKFAALVIDRDEERKWSFRSKGQFDVNTFAREHFEGGGHYNAAGGRSSESLDKTAQKFRDILKSYESQLQ